MEPRGDFTNAKESKSQDELTEINPEAKKAENLHRYTVKYMHISSTERTD